MRLVLAILAAAITIGAAYHAWPAINPDQKPSLIRPETARDAIKPKPRCMTPRIIILYTRGANGEPVPMIAVVVSVPCDTRKP